MKKKTVTPKQGDLQIWWIPQVPGEPFTVPVETLVEARLLLDVLANYDAFQFEHNIKSDYCNVGGLMVYDDEQKQFTDWYDEDGEDFDYYTLEQLRKKTQKCGS